MTRTRLDILIGILMLLVVTACDHTPDYVIKSKEMTSLLVDIHKGEGLIDLSGGRFRTDSMKKSLKQSILLEHGVTQEQFDTSLVWYGHNLEKYIEVYDNVIAQLEKDMKNADVAADGPIKVPLKVAGDSVNTWPESPFYKFTPQMPSQYVTFSLRSDENWEKGDVYTWRMYVSNRISPLNLTLAVEYVDGSIDYVTGPVGQDGWNEIVLPSDENRSMREIFGVMASVAGSGEAVYVDSISLVRTRFNPDAVNRASVNYFTNRR